MSVALVEIPTEEEEYTAYNAAADLFEYEGPEILLSGPANTGKSRACLEKMNWLAVNTPGFRGLIVRKTLQSLKGAGLVTFDEKVHPEKAGAVFHGDTAKRPPQYTYPNGAVIVIGGLDKPKKVMSSEYDAIYVQEATELTEEDWQALTIRLRNHKLPYQQIMADCNPDAPTHWLLLRSESGKTLMLESRHEDNPTVTPEDLARLDNLTGVWLLRYRHGIWSAAQGMIYAEYWDAARNLVNKTPIPREWPRYLGLDFGFSHPFCCQWWAVDPDGRLIMYREIYYTGRLVEDHAETIFQASGWDRDDGDPLPYALIADHDAEGRATLEAKLQEKWAKRMAELKRPYRGFPGTTPATKTVKEGIEKVQSRMRAAGDGKPRLQIMRDALLERDPKLERDHQPLCTVQELPGYIWDESKDAPIKQKDHGMDTMRYIVAHFDLQPTGSIYFVPGIKRG